LKSTHEEKAADCGKRILSNPFVSGIR